MDTKLKWVTLTDEIKSDKWRNLMFLKDGRSSMSGRTYPSEEMAKAGIDEWYNLCGDVAANSAAGKIRLINFQPIFLFPIEFSHAMQIPWKE